MFNSCFNWMIPDLYMGAPGMTWMIFFFETDFSTKDLDSLSKVSQQRRAFDPLNRGVFWRRGFAPGLKVAS